MKVVILGVSGMLGHKLCQVAAACPDFEVTGIGRESSLLAVCEYFANQKKTPDFQFISKLDDILHEIPIILRHKRPDFVVNCIGYIKHRGEDAVEAIRINALLPQILAKLANVLGFKLVQISSDCAFNGVDGFYNWESNKSDSDELPYYTSFSTPNADDLYGRTKALSEIRDCDNAVTIRTSIVGPELAHKTGLLEWYLSQRNEPRIGGYQTHHFSGVSTLQLSRVICDVIENLSKGVSYRNIEQYASVPISKYELLLLMKKAFGGLVDITPMRVKPCNRVLWKTFAGESPNWSTMVEEMAADWRENYADSL